MSHKIQQKTTPIAIVSVLILLIFLIMSQGDGLGPGQLFGSGTTQTVFTQTGASVTYDHDSQPYFYSNNRDAFYFATKDGISYITTDGQIKWNFVYNFSQPTVKAVRDIVAVSEIGGRAIHVFGINGRMYSKDFDQPILFFSVNRLGYLNVQLKKDSDYETKIYDATGEIIFEYKHQDYNTYPISSDISGDGRIAAFNILEVGGLHMAASLSFSYTYGNSRSAYAAFKRENQLISTTKFIENNRLISVSDTEISSYAAGDDNYLIEVGSITLNNKLSYFGFIGERGFAYVLGQGLLNKPAEPENLLKIFNSQVVEIGQFNIDKPVTYFHTGNDAVIVGSYSTYYALSDKGTLLWEYVAPGDIKQMIFHGNSDTIIIAMGSEAAVYKRSKSRNF